MARIVLAIESLKGYFKKFNGARYDEAMQLTFTHACRHYSERNGEMIPYIKSLARTILLNDEKDIPMEGFEELLPSEQDLESECILDLVKIDNEKIIIQEIVLPCMKNFLRLGELFTQEEINLNNISTYFPQSFKNVCKTVMKKVSPESFIN
jgi:hypothetical protein